MDLIATLIQAKLDLARPEPSPRRPPVLVFPRRSDQVREYLERHGMQRRSFNGWQEDWGIGELPDLGLVHVVRI